MEHGLDESLLGSRMEMKPHVGSAVVVELKEALRLAKVRSQLIARALAALARAMSLASYSEEGSQQDSSTSRAAASAAAAAADAVSEAVAAALAVLAMVLVVVVAVPVLHRTTTSGTNTSLGAVFSN